MSLLDRRINNTETASQMLPSSRPAAAFTEQQLKQLRAQCIVFLAFRNEQEPRKLHLEIALGGCVPAAQDGGRRAADGDGRDGATSSRSQESSSAAGLPLPPAPHLLPVSSLRLSSPATEQENHHRHEEDRAAVHDE